MTTRCISNVSIPWGRGVINFNFLIKNTMTSHDHVNNQSMGHHAMPSVGQGNIRALKITTWLTGIYFIIELGLGIYSGSIAVISDAFHTFSAVG